MKTVRLESEVSPLVSLSLQNISYSRLNTYKMCQLKYFYSYILKLPEQFGNAALLGNIVHQALEITLKEGYGIINHRDLFDNYNIAVQELDSEQRIPPSMIESGKEMLTDYVRDNQSIQTTPLEYEVDFYTEMPFSIIIGQGRFNGFIDHILVDDRLIKVTDYKSGKWEIAQKNTSTDLQLGIYALVTKYLWPDKDVYAELYYLRSGKRKGHLFTDGDLSQIEDNLVGLVDDVLSTTDYKPTPNEHTCTICSYAKDGTCSVGGLRLKKKGILQ